MTDLTLPLSLFTEWEYLTDRDDAGWNLEDLPPLVLARIKVNLRTGCWIYDGPTDADGYGKYCGRNTHRIIWERLVGPVKPKLVLDHREDDGCTLNAGKPDKACGYPGHLREVTNRENSTRNGCFGVGAINGAKTHCSVCGTAYDDANTYKYQGTRNCRTCNRAAVARYKARLKAKAQAEAHIAQVADAWDALATWGAAA